MPKEKRLVRRAKKNKPIRQVAAIPYRLTAGGGVEVLLVTSNTTKRFIVPKGWPMKSKTGREAATIEAFEEAGVTGTAAEKPFGGYAYWKRLSGAFVKVNVKIFLLPVDDVLTDWEEQGKRARAWLSPADAASLIDEPELAALVLSLAERFPEKPKIKGKPAQPPERKTSAGPEPKKTGAKAKPAKQKPAKQ